MVSLDLIARPYNADASGNRRVRLSFGYGKSGEDYINHYSSAYQTLNYGASAIRSNISISGFAPATFEKGDTGYIQVTHLSDSAAHTVKSFAYYDGIRLT